MMMMITKFQVQLILVVLLALLSSSIVVPFQIIGNRPKTIGTIFDKNDNASPRVFVTTTRPTTFPLHGKVDDDDDDDDDEYDDDDEPNGGGKSGGRQSPPKQRTVQLDTTLTEDKIKSLFAWIQRAFSGDDRYNNLMLAVAAIFGDFEDDSIPVQMIHEARKDLPENDETLVGDKISGFERERSSLGAMGAAQWTGQWTTRPHALLDVSNMTNVDDWISTLPRGCKRTIKRALSQNFTVTPLPILGGQPAPHSSLAHFRCVVEHEVRLLTYGPYGFVDAMSEAMWRYISTTKMTGEIREYRNSTTGQVIAIAHEVGKGKTIRGQWFYATNEAAQSYVWFHSVYELVKRAIDDDRVTVVDLGPSGSDAFSQLKEKYGFLSVEDWPAIADYQGDFWYGKDVQHITDTYVDESKDSILQDLMKRLFSE